NSRKAKTTTSTQTQTHPQQQSQRGERLSTQILMATNKPSIRIIEVIPHRERQLPSLGDRPAPSFPYIKPNRAQTWAHILFAPNEKEARPIPKPKMSSDMEDGELTDGQR